MPRRYTMGTLVTLCKQRCDLENDSNISTAEWKAMISMAYGKVHATVSETGLAYFETTHDITSTGAESYDEPDDHFMTVGIDYISDAGSGRRQPLREAMAQERPSWSGQTGTAVAYSHIDDQIFLYPTPPTGHVFEMRYVPQPPDISSFADSSPIDVATPDGESMLIWGVAIMALHKQGRDERRAVDEHEKARVSVFEWAAMKNLNNLRRPVLEDALDSPRYPGDWDY